MKADRRDFLKMLTGLVAASGFLVGGRIFAADPLSSDVLAAELYAKNEKEKNYVKEVVRLMEKGTLPKSYVYASRKYALKRKHTQRMIYFDRCLRQLCARAGIKLNLPSFM